MIITETPLRVSLLGGGTDFEDYYREHGGAVLSSAIDKRVYVIVKRRYDDMIYVNYSRKEIVERMDDLEHDLIREAMRLTGVERGIEVTTLSDIPDGGTGLGSSSSVTVGVLHALHLLRGYRPAKELLARQACQIEIDILGKPIGRQDQYIAAYGGLRYITFDNTGVCVHCVQVPDVTWRRLNESLCLFYTGQSRQASGVLREQRENIPLRLEVLRELRCLAYLGRLSLESHADSLGELMHRGWELKRQLASGISTPQLDAMYAAALEAGATGGKIAGAGGGGFLLLFVPPERQQAVRTALAGLKEWKFNLSPHGSRVIFEYEEG